MREVPEPALAPLTTIRLGGKALALLCPESVKDLECLPERVGYWGGDPYFIGKGSNLLFQDGSLPLVLISLRDLAAIDALAEDGATMLVRAQAGTPLQKFLRFCAHHGLAGLEGLAGIPGSVGGACAMNAGSFGSVFAEHVYEIEIWTGEGLKILSKDKLSFAYRHFSVPGLEDIPLVVSVSFALTKAKKDGIFRRMNLNYFEKKTRQPLTCRSAGCAFKNPAGALSAGQLLERAGFRGRKYGGMAFSKMHANFLINENGGSSAAAIELMDMARQKVKEISGISLETEIKIVPWRS